MTPTRLKPLAQQYDSKLQEELGMPSSEVKKIAQLYDISPKGLSKQELIRRIQRKEGNFDCFASATAGECDQDMCLWRKDCLELPKSAPH